jgi:hypothetical protein
MCWKRPAISLSSRPKKFPLFLDAKFPNAQVAGMIQTSTADLEKLAQDAAREIAGPEAFEQVEIEPGLDLDDRPIYHFTFLINQERAKQRAGMVRILLSRRLREELEARGDEHLPALRMLDRTDWEKRGSARFF